VSDAPTDSDIALLTGPPEFEAPSFGARANRIYKCEICGKEYKGNRYGPSNLRKHMASVHGQQMEDDAPPSRRATVKRQNEAELKEAADGFAMVLHGLGGIVLSQWCEPCGQRWAAKQRPAASAWFEGAKGNSWVRRFLGAAGGLGTLAGFAAVYGDVPMMILDHQQNPGRHGHPHGAQTNGYAGPGGWFGPNPGPGAPAQAPGADAGSAYARTDRGGPASFDASGVPGGD
jgi:hypothetical protein